MTAAALWERGRRRFPSPAARAPAASAPSGPPDSAGCGRSRHRPRDSASPRGRLFGRALDRMVRRTSRDCCQNGECVPHCAAGPHTCSRSGQVTSCGARACSEPSYSRPHRQRVACHVRGKFMRARPGAPYCMNRFERTSPPDDRGHGRLTKDVNLVKVCWSSAGTW
jgi:hypothetical protein